jgi:thiol-disulfide isomerase/thioredoxin
MISIKLIGNFELMKNWWRIVLFIFVFLTVSKAQEGLTFQTLGGGAVSLERSANNKIIVLAIGASWLPLSKQQASIANRLAKKYASRNDVLIYFVFTDSKDPKSRNFASDEQITKFAQENKISVDILRDPDGLTSSKKLKIDQLPSFVVIGKNGVVVEKFDGLGLEAGSLESLVSDISKVIDNIF